MTNAHTVTVGFAADVPETVQNGADAFPASLPETRAVIDFVVNHENIAGAQTYHNSGGMILRGPGQARYALATAHQSNNVHVVAACQVIQLAHLLADN